MAAVQQISIKLLVDKEKNRVLYAESYHDFVDLLFSFLTLPLGTITRLLRGLQSAAGEVGCMNNLYNSVHDLNASHLHTDACKKMLLYPDIVSKPECTKFILNSESRERRQLYLCGKFSADCLLSANRSVRCPCGSDATFSAYLEEPSSGSVSWTDGVETDGLFVKGALGERYIISDDLHVMASSISTCMLMLDKLGIGDDVSKIEETSVTLGYREILLLKRAWCSQTPLTDVFLSNQGARETHKKRPRGTARCREGNETPSTGKKFKLKLILRKLTNKVLYAEADHAFVDQLFSFLTFPLGSVYSLLDGKYFSRGSIHNTHTSVTELSSNSFLKSKECETLLKSPKLAPFLSCENQLLSIEEEAHPRYNCTQKTGNGWKLFALTEVDAASFSNTRNDGNKGSTITEGLILGNPKSTLPGDKTGGGFVKGPSKFMITDDLVVTPLSHTSCLFFLKRSNVSYDDIEERVVEVGEVEVLNLLQASLSSDTALSTLVEVTDDV